MLPVISRRWFPTLFDDMLNDDEWITRFNATTPAVNIKEDSKEYVMEIAAPGLKKEYCRVNVTSDGNLDVIIENKLEHKDENKKLHYLRREFAYSNYQHSYELPENADREKIEASVHDGVLEVVIPKLTVEEEEKVQRQIDIK